MHQNVINEIFKQYQKNGYVSEDSVFDALIDNNISLDQVDHICETVLSMGVIIKNDEVSSDDESFVTDRSQIDFEEIYTKILEIDDSLKLLVDRVRLIIPPQNREWITLIPQAQNGNLYARDRLIDMYLRVVLRLALQHHQRFGISLSDAIQDGAIGLVIAIEKFDMARQENLGQYIPWWIRQNIMREAEPFTSYMRHPVHFKDRMFVALDIMTQHGCYEIEYDEIEIISEIARKLDSSLDETMEIVAHINSARSIEDLVEEESYLLNDNGYFAREINERLDTYYLHNKIMLLLDELDDRGRVVIKMRYGIGDPYNETKTLEEVGEIYGVTRERIRQIEAKSIRKLKNKFKSNFHEY